MSLTGKQKRFLRALAHPLSAIVQVGKEGVTEAVVAATDAALKQHELIKVKLGSETPEDRHDAADALSNQTGSELAQVVGRTIILYRKHAKKPLIVLPTETTEGRVITPEPKKPTNSKGKRPSKTTNRARTNPRMRG